MPREVIVTGELGRDTMREVVKEGGWGKIGDGGGRSSG
jgi:hypothetical protein